MNTRKYAVPLVVVLLLLAAALACSTDDLMGGGDPGGGSDFIVQLTANAQATLDAGGGSNGGGGDGDGQAGGGTAPAVQTAEAEATAVAISLEETRVAREATAAAEAAGTAQAEAPIMADLATYGITRPGEVKWIHRPYELDVEGYLQFDYFNERIATISDDLVISTDLTWDTFTGLAGCGFLIRAEGEAEEVDGFMFVASRGGNGRVIFVTLQDGEMVEFEDVNWQTPIDWFNGATNRLAVSAEGLNFTVYTNGVNIGTVTAKPAYQYLEGFSAMVALSESGRTYCEFENTWLYNYD